VGIEWFRDLSITILGFVTTGVLVFAAVLAYRLYRSTQSTLLVVKAASKVAYDTATLVQEGVKSLLPILALVQGVRGGFEAILKMFKRGSNEGGNTGE
jgi:hypothetical protein